MRMLNVYESAQGPEVATDDTSSLAQKNNATSVQ